MELTAILKAELDLRHQRQNESFAAFQPGDRLTAKVLRLESDGRALVDLGGFRALAQTDAAITPGQILPLKVVSTGQTLVLKLMADPGLKASPPTPSLDLAGQLTPGDRQNLTQVIDRLLTSSPGTTERVAPSIGSPQSQTVRLALAQLKAALTPAPLAAPTPVVAQWVQTVLEDRGIFFEKKLADLAMPTPVPGEPALSSTRLRQLQAALDHLPPGDLANLKISSQGLAEAKETIAQLLRPIETPIATPQSSAPAIPTQPSVTAAATPPAVPSVMTDSALPEVVSIGVQKEEGSPLFNPVQPKEQGLLPHQMVASSQPGVVHAETSQPGAGVGDIAKLLQWVQTTLENQGGLADIAETERLPLERALKPLSALLVANADTDSEKPASTPQPDALQAERSIQTLIERDLKAHLLQLRQVLEQPTVAAGSEMELKPKEAGMLKDAVAQMLQQIEQQQERAIQRHKDPEPFQIFTHTLPTQDPNRPLKLKVYYPKRGSQEAQENLHRVAILLDLDRLGAVRADLSLLNRHLQVAFFVRNQAVRQVFHSQLDHIAAELKKSFEQIQVGVYVSEQKIDRFETEDVQESVGKVNIRA